MKQVILLALALVASASLSPADAARKRTPKKKQKTETPAKQPVQLVSSTDSVSYVAGMSLTNGLIPFLVNQQQVDTAYMADFLQGFKEVINAGTDPKTRARVAGMDIATQLRERMLPGLKKDFTDTPDSILTPLFFRGFTDALEKDTALFTQQAAETLFKEKQASNKAAREEKLYGANRRAGEQFLTNNAKKDSVVTLPSGLQYKVLTQGTGEVPQRTEKVFVNYEGRLIDGTVFDSSAKHGDKPAEFRPDQVIKGWTEALTLMPVGSKWQLFIPYQLAYGERAAGTIQPYSALIFDVELVGIDKPQPEADTSKEEPVAKPTKRKRKAIK